MMFGKKSWVFRVVDEEIKKYKLNDNNGNIIV